MYTLTILQRHFEAIVAARLHQPGTLVVSRAGRNRMASGTKLLCCPETLPTDAALLHTNADSVYITMARTAEELQPPWRQVLAATSRRGALTGCLSIGVEAARGRLAGAVIDEDGGLVSLHGVILIGAGMPTVLLTNPPAHQEPLTSDTLADRYSRTIGALGGADVWRLLRSMHAAVLGVGRTGSLLATTLVTLGVTALTLIDPDTLEAHNLDMDGVSPGALGQPKVTVVAEHLLTLRPDLALTVQARRLTTRHAIAALKRCDVLFCCVDNDAARLATTTLATLYLKPLVDVGTGVFLTPGTPDQAAPTWPGLLPQRQMGSDVRLLLPGDACLLCCGGLTQEAEARAQLAGRSLAPMTGSAAAWHEQRAGSLRPLNQLAAHLGVQLWLDLLAGRIRESLWARLEFDDTGHLHTQYPPMRSTSTSACPLCTQAGAGDAALGWREPV